ncbi:MAG: galactokinase [Planctomycetota bacterium]
MESRVRIAVSAVDAFERAFGRKPSALVRAPGRVNLIGEHTDYNEGFALPMAIDLAVWIAVAPRQDTSIRLHRVDIEETVEIGDPSDALPGGSSDRDSGRWGERARAVAAVHAQEAGAGVGFDGCVASDVPMGSGLASSAAFELAIIRALAAVRDEEWDPIAAARAVVQAENEWVGVKCGIMDPLVSAAAAGGAALLIDCRTLELSNAPLPPEVSFVVLDSGTRRTLDASPYNERRASCEETASALGIRSLRDAKIAELEEARRRGKVSPVAFRRARHVITENERTLLAAEALAQSDLDGFGDLVMASHRSLRDDFDVSTDALDTLVDVACEHVSCFGARLTGAGFGGCVIAAIEPDDEELFLSQVSREYYERSGLAGSGFVTRATPGAMEIDIARFV